MRKVDVILIEKEVERLFIEANYILPIDIKKQINKAISAEKSKLSKDTLKILKKNYEIAEEMIYPLCQDTGMAVIFIEVGNEVEFINGFIIDAINNGVKKAYNNGYLRKSIVNDPLKRINTNDNLPPIIHTELVKGDKVKLTAVPKGFGSENQSALKMMTPSDGKKEIIDFVVNGVISSESKGCPPSVIGVGIGGDFEYCAYLSKKALLIPLDQKNNDNHHNDKIYKEMEEEILNKINKSKIGPLGLGGKISCLGVNILTYPTHIAGLPVAYNYCCHACRHKTIVI